VYDSQSNIIQSNIILCAAFGSELGDSSDHSSWEHITEWIHLQSEHTQYSDFISQSNRYECKPRLLWSKHKQPEHSKRCNPEPERPDRRDAWQQLQRSERRTNGH